jgi:hypothetical protein
LASTSERFRRKRLGSTLVIISEHNLQGFVGKEVTHVKEKRSEKETELSKENEKEGVHLGFYSSRRQIFFNFSSIKEKMTF